MLESVPTQHLPDVCASIVRATPAEKVEVLDAVDLIERFRKTLPLLTRQIEVSGVKAGSAQMGLVICHVDGYRTIQSKYIMLNIIIILW